MVEKFIGALNWFSQKRMQFNLKLERLNHYMKIILSKSNDSMLKLCIETYNHIDDEILRYLKLENHLAKLAAIAYQTWIAFIQKASLEISIS